MTNWTTLPHERLIAFQVARKLLLAVSEAKISDPKLRDQALQEHVPKHRGSGGPLRTG